MRVTFNDHIKTLSGKCHCGKDVFSARKDDSICYKRQYKRPTITAHNTLAGAKFAKVVSLWDSVPTGFKEALQVYANAYNNQLLPEKKLPLSSFNVFIKALCNSTVTLSSLDDLSDIATLHGATVSEWMSNNLLQRVKGTMSIAEII